MKDCVAKRCKECGRLIAHYNKSGLCQSCCISFYKHKHKECEEISKDRVVRFIK